jgi:hypothetical protein
MQTPQRRIVSEPDITIPVEKQLPIFVLHELSGLTRFKQRPAVK